MNYTDYLILGYGYTAKALIQEIQSKEPSATVQVTSRTDASKVIFDLNQESTWGNLPKSKVCFWTFPPEPFSVVEKFVIGNKNLWSKLIVVGSTSAFVANVAGQKVTEDSPLDLTIERVRAEEFLLKSNATVVFSAGIYGKNRSPLDWIRKGLVGKNSKLVNMIHVDDLAQFLFNANKFGKSGATYIASDNNPMTWESVIENWEQRKLVSNVPMIESKRLSKKIDNSKTIKELQVNLKYRNFADSVS